MAELTKEQLIEEAKLKIAITKCHPNSGMARIEGELFKIALASLEAEPVAWKATFTQIDHEYNTFTAMYSDKAEAKRWVRLHKVGDFRAEITPLYAASPALVDTVMACKFFPGPVSRIAGMPDTAPSGAVFFIPSAIFTPLPDYAVTHRTARLTSALHTPPVPACASSRRESPFLSCH